MSRARAPRPEPTEIPRPLPHGVLAELIDRRYLLLCLDYDGTLAEICGDPSRAVPLALAREALAVLARHPDRLAVAIISGREIEVVRRLLGLTQGLFFAGVHGLELADRDGRRRAAPGVEECLEDLSKTRRFLADAVPANRGFVVEDKKFALTLHYRNADPAEARALLERFEHFVTCEAPHLVIMRGKMVFEALPSGVGGKGEAVRLFFSEAANPRAAIAYFGDDTTDEEAFYALRPTGALTVLVGHARPSFASCRIDSPSDLARLLSELVAHLEEPV